MLAGGRLSATRTKLGEKVLGGNNESLSATVKIDGFGVDLVLEAQVFLRSFERMCSAGMAEGV